MPSQYNPFQPARPIHDGAFAGRSGQLERINQVLLETREGNPTYLLFVGERGIGKTSLILATKELAEAGAAQKPDHEEGAHDFLCIRISVDQETRLADLCYRMSRELERALSASEKTLQFIRAAWSFIQRLEIAGTKVNAPKEGYVSLKDDLVLSLVDSVKGITGPNVGTLGLRGRKHGLVLFIDEADNASPELNLGGLIKELNERLAYEGCNNVLVVVAGLPSVKDVLASHQSTPRLFEALELLPLRKEESVDVITYGIAMANVRFRGRHTVEITQEAIDYIVELSGGHPYFLQQFGHSIYAADTDFMINKADVYAGAKRAVQALGSLYSDLYDRVRHFPLCTEVINKCATSLQEWLRYEDLVQSFGDRMPELERAITVLLEERILVRQPGAGSGFRLQWAGLAIWLRLLPVLPAMAN